MRRRAHIAAAALGLLASTACGGGGGGGGSGPAFVVTYAYPSDGAMGVPQDVVAIVTFSRPLDHATVGAYALGISRPGFGPLPGAATQTGSSSLKFVANATLVGGTTHYLQVSAALRSTSGDAISGPRSFAFLTTGSPNDVVLPSPTALRETDGRLVIGRYHHTATLLPDGTVLVAGGYAGANATDVAEIFDPVSETFTALPTHMRHVRAGHTAMRLFDGSVLLAGGWQTTTGSQSAAATAEVYDPGTKTFSDVGSMGSGRADGAALLLPDGRVFVAGGSASRNAANQFVDLASAEVYDPTLATWSPWPFSMTHTRALFGAADLSDGRWLLVGGSAADLRADVLDTSTQHITPVASPVGDATRFGPAVAAYLSGDVCVAGGDPTGSVLHFDRSSTTMISTGSGLTTPRDYATATPIAADRILVAGGIDFSQGGVVLSSCDLVAIGGVAGSRTYATQVHFTMGIADHAATVLLDGRILFTGGLDPMTLANGTTAAYVFAP